MTEELKARIAQINAGTAPTGYKKTKAGIVPEEWEVRRLSEISTELTERAGDREFETLSISAGIGFVNQANKFGKELSGKQYEKYIVLHRGDFSYNKGNSKKYPQGCIYMLRDRDAAAVPNVFESFRLNSGVNSFFEQLFISGFLNQQLFAKINHGVRDDGLLNLRGEDFYKCRVAVPSLPEQQKIAEILTAQDAVIALMQKQIELLQKQKKAFLQKMFPKKGCNVPEIRFAGFTDAWEQRKFSEGVSEIGDGLHGTPTYCDDGNVYFINGNNLVNGRIVINEDTKKVNEEQQSIADKSLDNTTILMSINGTIGNLAYYSGEKLMLGKSAAYIKVSEFNKKFVYIYLQTPSIQTYFMDSLTGTTIKNLGLKAIREMTMPIPQDIVEQKQIGEFFDSLDTLITLHQRKLEIEQQKKKALMQLLLTGKVRVKT